PAGGATIDVPPHAGRRLSVRERHQIVGGNDSGFNAAGRLDGHSGTTPPGTKLNPPKTRSGGGRRVGRGPWPALAAPVGFGSHLYQRGHCRIWGITVPIFHTGRSAVRITGLPPRTSAAAHCYAAADRRHSATCGTRLSPQETGPDGGPGSR